MPLHRSVGLADRTQTEVVRPTDQSPVEIRYQSLRVPLGLTPSGQLANPRTDALHPFLRRYGPQIGPARLRRIAPTKRIAQKVEPFFRQLADPRLRLVHRQLQLRHHVPHRGEGFSGLAPTTDHEVIGVVHDVRSETPLVSQLLPAEHEPAHVQIAEQGTDRSPLGGASTFIPIARTSMFISAFGHRRDSETS